jgi:sugar lactone lactonase YvrE
MKSNLLACGLCLAGFTVASAQTYTFVPLAGLAGATGSADGTGADARFKNPTGIALDGAGNVYVTDTGNHTLRRVTPAGTVTTLAGSAGLWGSTNGTGGAARFSSPAGVAADTAGNLYVADAGNMLIRKITPAGEVTTLAGSRGSTGPADGTGSAAQFDVPNGIAVDGSGNLYVTDADFGYTAEYSNQTVRKLTSAGVVTTLAGSPRLYGFADGTGAAARFAFGGRFDGLAVDRTGNVYLADTYNYAVRKLTPNGTVTTFAGAANQPGQADGTSVAARFSSPGGVAFDAGGNLFVTDFNRIRVITPDGVVTTVKDPSGNTARFTWALGITVDGDGNLYVIENNAVYKGTPLYGPQIASSPRSQTVAAGGTVVFAVSGGGSPDPVFQWQKDGVALAGATTPTLVIRGASAADAGSYVCTVTNTHGSVSSTAAQLTLAPTPAAGHIANFSVRAPAGFGAQMLQVGLMIGGAAPTATKPVLIRALGPSLAAFNLSGWLADPALDLYASGTRLTGNDNWGGDPQVAAVSQQVGAFALGANSKEAAFYHPGLAAGTYNMLLTGVTGAGGIALAEIYDPTPDSAFGAATPRLTNVSARTQVGLGDNVLIAGFIIGGQSSRTVLIRATGPALAAAGIPTGYLYDPQLQLFAGTTLLEKNNDWGDLSANAAVLDAVFRQIGAFPLAIGSRDAAILVTLPPGAYTAQVSGAGNDTGIALVEVYEVP